MARHRGQRKPRRQSTYDRLRKQYDKSGEGQRFAEEILVTEGTVGDRGDVSAYRKVALEYLDDQGRPVEQTLSIAKFCSNGHALGQENRIVCQCAICHRYCCALCHPLTCGQCQETVCRACGRIRKTGERAEVYCTRFRCMFWYWFHRLII